MPTFTSNPTLFGKVYSTYSYYVKTDTVCAVEYLLDYNGIFVLDHDSLPIQTNSGLLNDGTSLISILDGPDWLTLVSTDPATQSATLQGIPNPWDVGYHKVTLRAVDNLGCSSTQEFTITVLNKNHMFEFCNKVKKPDAFSPVCRVYLRSGKR